MLKEIYTTLRHCWRPLLVADLLFKLVATVVITPLVALAFRAFVSSSGRDVLADQDILRFVLSPIGLACMVCVGALVLATLVFEQAVLLRIVWASAAGENPRVRTAAAGAFADTWNTVKLGGVLVASALLLAAPYAVGLGLVYWWLLTGHDINYYLADKPPAFWAALALGAIVLLAGGAAFAWWVAARVLSVPILVVQRLNVRQAIERSKSLTAGRHAEVARWIAAWLAFVMLAPPLLLVEYLTVGGWLASRTESLPMLAFLVGVLTMVHMLLNFLVHVATVVGFALIVWNLWERLDDEAQATISSGATGESPATGPLVVWNRWRVAAVGLVLAMAAGLVGAASLAGIRLSDTVEIIAHRGGATHAPENSLAAVRQAILDNSDWIEIDVQETSDGKLAVVHDRDLKRVAGEPIEVHSATLEDLQQYDIGSGVSDSFRDERVATLNEVLDFSKQRVGVVIELKHYGFNQRLEERVVELVEQMEIEDEVMIISLDRASIAKVRELRPDWRIGLLTAVAVGNLNRVDADLLAVNQEIASPRLIGQAHLSGRQVAAWTLNDRQSLGKMISRGVDYVITDDVPLAQQVLAERREMSLIERWLTAVASQL